LSYGVLFFILLFIQSAILQTLFKPGFIAPDIVLIALVSKAYMSGRPTLMWAIFGGAFLDIMTDTIGLHLALETLSLYLFVLVYERLLFRTILTYLIPASLVLFLKEVLAFFIMRAKFSFELSLSVFMLSFLIEVAILLGVYFFYLRRKE